jgi:hypothetical protein
VRSLFLAVPLLVALSTVARRDRSSAVKAVASFLAVVAALVVAVLALGAPNDARLEAFRERVEAIPTPPNTGLAVYDYGDTAFGLMAGASNSCTFRVRYTYLTESSRSEVDAHYGQQEVRGVDEPARLTVYWGDLEGLYILEAESTTGAGWDWRCN